MFDLTFSVRYLRLARKWSAFCKARRGGGLFFRPVKWADRLLGPDRAWIEFQAGLYVPLKWDDFLVHNLILHGSWEDDEAQIVETIAQTSSVFLDVGANFGYFSMLAAQTMGAQGRVLAFEPNPEMVNIARRSFAKSSLKSIDLIPAAVGNDNGRLQLHLNGGPNRGKTSLYAGNTNGAGTVEVDCLRLDDFLSARQIPAVDFMKIDVEGHEWFALKGAIETLKAYRPAILMELVPSLLAQSGHGVDDVLNLLAPMGYEIGRRWHPDNYLLIARGTPAWERFGSPSETARAVSGER